MAEQKTQNKREADKRAAEERYPERWADTPIRDVFDRLIDDRTWLEPLEFFRGPRMISRFDRAFFPRIDVSETNTAVKVVADVPGVDPDNINIEVRENRMKISGTSEKERGEIPSDEKPYRYERSYGEFRREFSLPSRVKEDQVKAAYKNGVLTITLPKAEEVKRKKIEIEKQ